MLLKRWICSGIISIFMVAFLTQGALSKSAEHYYLLELFTSQSCSSCPAADALLQTLNSDTVIALSCNVTYWNHLHWEDTLSQDFCTQRQRQYSIVQGKNGRVFTPELMINGKKSIVGSRKEEITRYISNPDHAVDRLDIEYQNDHITFQPLKRSTSSKYNIILMEYGKTYTQHIPSGENSGRSVQYTNPVTSLKTLKQDWDGTTHITIPSIKHNSQLRYIVIVSDIVTQQIHAIAPLAAIGNAS